jgi:transitional endoplasmic reticulum ATPase
MEGVVVIGATNRPDMIDSALLRPGRFDRLIFVPPPDEKSRLAILKVHTKEMPLAADVTLEDLARKLDHYSGADLGGIVREAGMAAIRERSVKVGMRHFETAMRKVGGSCDPETVKYYQSMAKALEKGMQEKKEDRLRYFG